MQPTAVIRDTEDENESTHPERGVVQPVPGTGTDDGQMVGSGGQGYAEDRVFVRGKDEDGGRTVLDKQSAQVVGCLIDPPLDREDDTFHNQRGRSVAERRALPRRPARQG